MWRAFSNGDVRWREPNVLVWRDYNYAESEAGCQMKNLGRRPLDRSIHFFRVGLNPRKEPVQNKSDLLEVFGADPIKFRIVDLMIKMHQPIPITGEAAKDTPLFRPQQAVLGQF